MKKICSAVIMVLASFAAQAGPYKTSSDAYIDNDYFSGNYSSLLNGNLLAANNGTVQSNPAIKGVNKPITGAGQIPQEMLPAGAVPLGPNGQPLTSADNQLPGADIKPNPKELLYAKLNYILNIVDEAYIAEPDFDKIEEGVFGGMLSKLDPHSAYFNEKQLRSFSDTTRGTFTGIGISIEQEGEFVKVISVIKDSPAHNAGVRDGDVIFKVGEKSLQSLDIEEVVDLIRGPKGTVVDLAVKHESENDPVVISVKRAEIIERVVTSHWDNGIIYLYLSHFKENTTKEMVEDIRKLIAANGDPTGFVLDLRSNPGGSLPEAIGVSSVFLPENSKIVTIKGRTSKDVQVMTTRDFDKSKVFELPKYFDTIPLAVLINGSSASASEIVAGSLRSYRRATLIGQTSFGKGSVQSLINLPDNSGIKITIAKYYTPDDRSIQALGVNPSVYLKEEEVADKKVSADAVKTNWEKILSRKEKMLDGHLYGEDKTKIVHLSVSGYKIPKQDLVTQSQYDKIMKEQKQVLSKAGDGDKPVKNYAVFGGNNDIYVDIAESILGKRDVNYPKIEEKVLDFAPSAPTAVVTGKPSKANQNRE